MSWGALLPTASIGMPPVLGAGPGTTPVGVGTSTVDVSDAFGGKYVALGRRALAAYSAWQNFPVMRFDVSQASQTDDQELAKLIAQYGAIPADSDLGALAIAAGARTYKQRVRFSDGSSAAIDVVQVGSRKGGADAPEDKPRRRRKNLTRDRLTTAAWVMRKLHAQQKLGKRLARTAQRLYPTRRSSAKGKRRR